MRITELGNLEESMLSQVAQLLMDGFSHLHPHPWPSRSDAMDEVHESLEPDRLSLVAQADDEQLIGWVGAIRQYSGNVWEVHPLVVSPRHRLQGVGSHLMRELEIRVKDHGALTLWLGTDDVMGQTSLAGKDVYPNPLTQLSAIKNLRGHPVTFYEKLGFSLLSIMPDANGFGKPDIFMAKRVRDFR